MSFSTKLGSVKEGSVLSCDIVYSYFPEVLLFNSVVDMSSFFNHISDSLRGELFVFELLPSLCHSVYYDIQLSHYNY